MTKLSTEDLEKFLELEKKGTPEAIIQRVAQSRTIAPQAVRELIEARRLLWLAHGVMIDQTEMLQSDTIDGFPPDIIYDMIDRYFKETGKPIIQEVSK